MCSYYIDAHRKRFAAWAAVTAARASKKCRFTRSQGISIIEQSTLSRFVQWTDLPDPVGFDVVHKNLRLEICNVAIDVLDREPERFTHGVAAKLVNVYLKSMYLSGAGFGGADTEIWAKANALHPPIDRLLLTSLAANDIGGKASVWRKQATKGWSNFTSSDYEDVISEIRAVTGGELWKVEEHWLSRECACRKRGPLSKSKSEPPS